MALQQVRKFIPLVLAVVFVLLSVNSISYKSHTRDEARHLVRGVMLLETGDYRLNKHHPILGNVISAFPQLFNDELVVPSTDSDNWRTAAKDELSDELVDINGGKRDFVFNVLNNSRYFMIFVFAISGLFVVSQTNNEFGSTVAIIFSFLYFLSSNLIANARLVTTDALVVPLVFSATFLLYLYAKYDNFKHLVSFVLVGFCGLITKYSVVPVAVVWLIILTVILWKNLNKTKAFLRFLRVSGYVLAICLTWTVLLWGTYGFRFETLQFTNHENIQKTENNLSDIENIFKLLPSIIEPAQNLYLNKRLPFPEYIDGFLDNVVFHNAYGHDTFLFGQYSKTGWWYYFPLSMLVKMPISILIGIGTLMAIGVKYLIDRKFRIGPLLILFVVPAFFMLISMISSLNLGIRYILVVFPFLYLGVSYLVVRLFRSRQLRYPIVLLGTWYMLSTIMIYPHYLEYFNEIVGGPQNGYYYLLDSNLSWAQDDFYVKDYIEDLPDDTTVYVNPLEEVEEGTVVIDVDLLMGRDINKRPKTEWIRGLYLNGEIEPIKRIAYTYLVFEF